MLVQLDTLILTSTCQLVSSVLTSRSPSVSLAKLIEKLSGAALDLPNNIRTSEDLRGLFSKIVEKKNGSMEKSRSQKVNSKGKIKVTFKNYLATNYEEVSQEIWYFEIEEKKYQKQNIEQIVSQEVVQYLQILTKVIQDSIKAKLKSQPKTSEKSTQLQLSQNQAGFFTDCTIEYNSCQTRIKPCENKTLIEVSLGNFNLKTTVIYSSKTVSNTPTTQEIRKQYGRKLSSDTNCTENSKKEEKLSRRLSLFSFYDEENDVTVLSNNKEFASQYGLEEESVMIEDQNEDVEKVQDDEEVQFLETQDDCNLRKFKQALKFLEKQMECEKYNIF